MPVWRFNSLQLLALRITHDRRKKAEEMSLLAMLHSNQGNAQEAMDCYLRMTELNRAERLKSKLDFTESSIIKYKRMLKNIGKVNSA